MEPTLGPFSRALRARGGPAVGDCCRPALAPRPGLTVRAHVPAQVAAVLEDFAAGAALVDSFVLPQLPDELPPDAMSAGQNQAPFEG
jgi:hypothetical protein